MSRYVDFLMLLYAGAGVFGALWVTDDFDELRFAAMTFVGVPALALHILLRLVSGAWHRRWKKTYAALLLAVALAFALGHVAYLNAISAAPQVVKRTVSTGQRLVHKDVRRGGLGLLHRQRW
jgi:hypothetical protein